MNPSANSKQNLLVIDAGNSRLKFGFGESATAFPVESSKAIPCSEFSQFLNSLPDAEMCVVSSVRDDATSRIREAFANRLPPEQLVFLSSSNSPIVLNIDHPETLGPDRIAAAAGAYARTQCCTIVVDSGTATTIDLVDEEGVFQGGTIFPGFELALDSLAAKTNRLPEVRLDFHAQPPIVGRDTRSAIQSGVFWSVVGGVESIVQRLQKDSGAKRVLVTGGNGQQILKASLLTEAECIESLVLEGLWQLGQKLISA